VGTCLEGAGAYLRSREYRLSAPQLGRKESHLRNLGLTHDAEVCRLSSRGLNDRHRELSHEVVVEHGEELDRIYSCGISERAALVARLHNDEDLVPEALTLRPS